MSAPLTHHVLTILIQGSGVLVKVELTPVQADRLAALAEREDGALVLAKDGECGPAPLAFLIEEVPGRGPCSELQLRAFQAEAALSEISLVLKAQDARQRTLLGTPAKAEAEVH